MIIISKLGIGPVKLWHKWFYQYHLEDMMKRSYVERKNYIYPGAMHLYLDKLIKEPFNERRFINILLENDKLGNSRESYEKLFEYAETNIDKFLYFKSMSTILTVAFQANYKNKEICYKFGRRGFDIFKQQKTNQFKTQGYTIIRFIIGINKLVGLQKYSNEDYQLIQITKIKPIFLTFLLELFWRSNLQNNYQFAQKLLQCLVKNKHLIPFSDAHHMMMAKKKIKSSAFYDLTDSIQQRIKEKVKETNETGQQTRVNPKVTKTLFKSYIRDLQTKYL